MLTEDMLRRIQGLDYYHDEEEPRWPYPGAPTVKGNYNRKGASATSGDGLATVIGGMPNPTWVEWLMGYRMGWTELPPLATLSSRKSRK